MFSLIVWKYPYINVKPPNGREMHYCSACTFINTYTAISLLLDSKQKMFLIKGNDGFMNLKPAAGFLAPCRRT